MSSIDLTAEEEALPVPEPLDFDEAELVKMPSPGSGVVLRVRGTAPCLNMKVRLSPVRYVQQPDYWAIHVVGDLPGGVCLDAIRDYDETIHAPLGKKGVVVIGRTKRQQLENP